jgi:glycosyltransferase involved in cell wall biosynthesis
MSKTKLIFLGTDLHGPPTELASKTVRSLKNLFRECKILSIQNRKPSESHRNIWITPKLSKFNIIRKGSQALLLPFYLGALRFFGFSKIFSFWVANSAYHRLLFKFTKFLGFKTIFTVISEKPNLSVLKECDTIVCQSERMMKSLSQSKELNLKYIPPSIDLNTSEPNKKSNPLLVASIPYDVKDFKDRGIDVILDFIKKNKISSKIIFRSDESYNYVKSLKMQNAELINKSLSDEELSKLMAQSKIMPLIYTKNAPDMPLSAIEGLSSGCAIICTPNMGISDIIKKEKAGIVINSPGELHEAIQKIMKSAIYSKNARKAAEKHFLKSNLKNYIGLA